MSDTDEHGSRRYDAVRLEYQNLRSEVEESIRNQVRILGYGGTALSLLLGVGIVQASQMLLVSLPFLAFFFAVLWNIEQTRMMRAGDYISTIEKRLNQNEFEEPVMLWETWLRFRASNQPEGDIYQRHYQAQYVVIGIFMLIILGGMVGLWVERPESVPVSLAVGLTVVYAGFLLMTLYFLQAVVRHESVEHSFDRFHRIETEAFQDDSE